MRLYCHLLGLGIGVLSISYFPISHFPISHFPIPHSPFLITHSSFPNPSPQSQSPIPVPNPSTQSQAQAQSQSQSLDNSVNHIKIFPNIFRLDNTEYQSQLSSALMCLFPCFLQYLHIDRFLLSLKSDHTKVSIPPSNIQIPHKLGTRDCHFKHSTASEIKYLKSSCKIVKTNR